MTTYEPLKNEDIKNERIEYIWYYLNDLLGNKKAAAGLMGYLYYVSRLDPKFHNSIELGSTPYDEYVDLGKITRNMFIRDGVAFGIGGWSEWFEKQGLYNMMKRGNCTISNLRIQLNLLKDSFYEGRYTGFLAHLMDADNIEKAVDICVTEYAKLPEDEINLAKHTSYIFAKAIHDVYARGKNLDSTKKDIIVRVCAPKTAVRTGASIFSKKVAVAAEGDTFLYINLVKDGKWVCVLIENYFFGYIRTKDVELYQGETSEDGEDDNESVD